MSSARPPASRMHVEFYRHNIEPDDIERAVEALQSIFLTTGPVTAEFESHLAGALGVRHALGLMSCTHGLFLALKAMGIGPGDEVITTPMSFVATANTIIEAGARPVFVDVERDTGNIDAKLVESAITPRTRAIMPVHLYGQLCDMRRLRALADRHRLAIIEDSAHAIDAERDGVRPGQLGDVACFSFYATKPITSGEGGAVATDDGALADAVRELRLHGMSKHAIDRYQSFQHYDVERLGYKANMSDIQAALLLGQLRRLSAMRHRCEEICARYERGFAGVRGIELPRIVDGSRSARHLFTIQVDPSRRDAVLSQLQTKEIGVAVNFRPIHLFSYYRETFSYRGGEFPEAERIGASTISLPLYPRLLDEEVDYVIDTVRQIVG